MSDNIEGTRTVSSKYSMFPPKDEQIYKFFKIQETSLWSINEIDFSSNAYEYRNLPPVLQKLVGRTLAFLTPADGAINKNVALNFLNKCQSSEESWMFISQLYIEAIHAETYGTIMYAIFGDDEARELEKEIDESPYSLALFEFMEKWIYATDVSESERLFAFSCVEGMAFCVLFLVFYYLRKKNLLNEIVYANMLIVNDESLHKDQTGYLHQKREQIPIEGAHEIMLELHSKVCDFVGYLLPEPIEELNQDGMKLFLNCVTDCCLHSNGYPSYFNTKNPYPWADEISLLQKNNFFEVKAANYKRGSLQDAVNYRRRAGKEPKLSTKELIKGGFDF